MLVDSRRLKLPFTSASGFPHGVCPCRHKISPKIESTTFQCFPIFNRFARILTTILTANPMVPIIQKRPRRPNTSDLLAGADDSISLRIDFRARDNRPR